MPLTHRRISKPSPSVTTAAARPEPDIRGRRLGTLSAGWLRLVCDCGHAGVIPVADIAAHYGRKTHLRDALAKVRCTRCGQTRTRKISLTK